MGEDKWFRTIEGGAFGNYKSEKAVGSQERITNTGQGASLVLMTDEPIPVGEESYSSTVQRMVEKSKAKSSRETTAIGEMEDKTPLDRIRVPSGGFITESRSKAP